MVKTVFSNDMVAHVWANQSQSEGRSHNGNFSFRDSTIYSYSTAIARFVKDANGGQVCLINERTYSMTTSSKHMPAVRRAVDYGRAGYPVFYVPCLGLNGPWSPGITAEHHAVNVGYYLSQLQKMYERALKPFVDFYADGHKNTAESRADAIARQFEITIGEYCRVFGLDCPDLKLDEKRAALIAAFAKFNDPKAVAKREKARAKSGERRERREAAERERKRLAAQAAHDASIDQWLAWRLDDTGDVRSPSSWQLLPDSPEREAVESFENAERYRREAEQRIRWLAGESVYWHGRDAEGGALLRVRNDQLETSQGASVPLEHAVKAFRFIKLIRERGEAWRRNGHSVRVGHFTVDEIRPDGSIRAGCHLINWPEIERVARLIGVAEDAPSADAEVSTVAA